MPAPFLPPEFADQSIPGPKLSSTFLRRWHPVSVQTWLHLLKTFYRVWIPLPRIYSEHQMMQKTHKHRLTLRNFLACFTFYIQVPNKARYSTLVEKLLVHRKWDRLVIYWHALIVEEISNVDVKCVKVTAARNVGQGHRDKVSVVEVSRRITMQGLVVVGPLVEEISNVDVQCFKVTGVRNIGQGQWSSYLQSVHRGKALSAVKVSRRNTMQCW